MPALVLGSIQRSLTERLHHLLKLQRSLASACTGSLVAFLYLCICISCESSISLLNFFNKFFHNILLLRLMMHKDIKKHYIQAFSAIFLYHFSKKNPFFAKKSTHNVKECSNYQANSSLISRTPYLYMTHAHPSSTYNNQQHNSPSTQKHRHSFSKYYLQYNIL